MGKAPAPLIGKALVPQRFSQAQRPVVFIDDKAGGAVSAGCQPFDAGGLPLLRLIDLLQGDHIGLLRQHGFRNMTEAGGVIRLLPAMGIERQELAFSL